MISVSESFKELGLLFEKRSLRFEVCDIRVIRMRARANTSGLNLDGTGKYIGVSGPIIIYIIILIININNFNINLINILILILIIY